MTCMAAPEQTCIVKVIYYLLIELLLSVAMPQIVTLFKQMMKPS